MRTLPITFLTFALALQLSAATSSKDFVQGEAIKKQEFILEGIGSKSFHLENLDESRELLIILNELRDKLEGDQELTSIEDLETFPEYVRSPEIVSKKKLRKYLEYMSTELEKGINNPKELASQAKKILIVHQSLLLKFRKPLDSGYSVSKVLYRVIKEHSIMPYADGKNNAFNGHLDSIKEDPKNSSFWTKPKKIQALDLSKGFFRNQTLGQEIKAQKENCTYKEKKTSFGINPGFVTECGKKEYKIKFGETKSEPFGTRIFWALGYNVDPVDHLDSFTFKYDRHFFTELNQREKLVVEVKALGKKVTGIQLTEEKDPFSLIKKARLINGKTLSGDELRKFLLKDSSLLGKKLLPNLESDNFIAKNEEMVSELVTLPVQIQAETEKDSVKVGPWTWEDLEPKNLRETRGMVAIAAWLGWRDCRYDNNRLLLVSKDKKNYVMKHVLSDLGGILGGTQSFINGSQEKPYEMLDTITRRGVTGNFEIVSFNTLDKNKAWEEASVEDIKWGAKWLSRLSDQQIWSAILASGFKEEEARTVYNKLYLRREKMLKDLKLTEFLRKGE
jgi:hypothetical protein